jgi:hypothetical protein
LEALLAKVTLAEAMPLTCGVNFTVNDALWPAAMVRGKEIPLSTNSDELENPEERVTLAPVALRLPVRLLPAPTVTLPKLRVAGETVNSPAAVPVPEREIVSVAFEALDITEMLPVTAPVFCGANIPLNVRLCPAVRVTGKLRPGTLNPAPVTFTWVMVTLEAPVFVMVSEAAALLLT